MTIGLEIFRRSSFSGFLDPDMALNSDQMLYELHDEVTFTFNKSINAQAQRYMYQEVSIKPYVGGGVPLVAIQARSMRSTDNATYVLVSAAALQSSGAWNKVGLGIVSMYGQNLNRSMKIRVYTPIFRASAPTGFGIQVQDSTGWTKFSSDKKLMRIKYVATCSGRYTRNVDSHYSHLITDSWTDLVRVYAMFNWRRYDREEGIPFVGGDDWVVTSNFCQSLLTSDTLPYDQGYANYRMIGFYTLRWPETPTRPEEFDIIPITIDFWFDTADQHKGEFSDYSRFGFLCTVD